MEKSVVIVGGGLGGLFTGALLSKEKYEVTILEKNMIIGGGLQCFSFHGISFETGMHIIGGFLPDGNLNMICSYLGIRDKLLIKDTDEEAIDSITYGEDGKTYTLPRGKEKFTGYLQKMFPKEAENIQRYMDALYAISQEVDLFYLRPGTNEIFNHSEDFIMATDAFIAKYVKDARLRDILAYMSPMYGGIAGITPAFIHAMINVLYINGSSQFVGGSQQLATSLCEIIEENGGKVFPGDPVEQIMIEDKIVRKVKTSSGKQYKADWYISSVHPEVLFKLTGSEAFPKAYYNRINSIPNSYSAFSLYIKFKHNSQPYINHPRYYQEHYGDVWKISEYDEETFPKAFMYITPPMKNQGLWAEKMIINCIMPFSAVKQWENTLVGRRGEEYKKWKNKLMNKVLNKLNILHPGFSDSIDSVIASSPLTIRDYYGSKEGSLYGHMCDCNNPFQSQMPIATKVKNLLLTGQNVNLHGICGVPLTAIETAEYIVGRNEILGKIKNI